MKKVIDEKGRLFQKFNLIDTLVVLILVIIIAAIGIKLVSAGRTAAEERKAEEMAQEYENAPHLRYEVVCSDIPEEVALAFEAQMELPLKDRQLMSGGSAIDGYLTGCTIEPDEEGTYTVYFSLEALISEKDDIYSVGSQEIRLGKGHIVKTYQIETSGYIYAMEADEEPEDE